MVVEKALVTGASGYIGSRLVCHLLQQGIDVVTVTRESPSIAKGTNVKCDLANQNLDDQYFEGVDVVFHLAAVTHDASNRVDRDYYFALNVDATMMLARQSNRLNVRKFIYVSSVKAIDSGKDEFVSKVSEGVYGASKFKAETDLVEFGHRTNMEIEIVRPSLVYGPDAPGNIGQMKKAIAQGWFPPLPDFGNIRSMVHVDDLVRLLSVLAHIDNPDCRRITITDGERYSSADVYDILRTSLGLSVPNYRMPKTLFYIARKLHPTVRHHLDKLIESKYYASEGLEEINFKTRLTLNEIDVSEFVYDPEMTDSS